MIKNVFAELQAKAPEGVHYMTLSLSDGTFVHFATVEETVGDNPIPKLDAFKAFTKDIAARCVEQSASASVVGNYRMIDE